MNEKLLSALDEISDRHITEAARHKPRRPYRFMALAAMLALVILICALGGTRPDIVPTDPPIIGGTPPITISFASIRDLKAITAVARWDEDAYSKFCSNAYYIFDYNVGYLENQAYTQTMAELLESIKLPCSNIGFSTLIYYPETTSFTITYIIDDIRYLFGCTPGNTLHDHDLTLLRDDLSISGVSFDLYDTERYWKYSQALLDGWCIALRVYTDDASKVDLSNFYFGNLLESPTVTTLAGQIGTPQYPDMLPYPFTDSGDAYLDWQENQARQYDQPEGYADSLTGFFKESIRTVLLDTDGNAAYSPASAYLTLAMLAEVSGGSSRQEILALLGADSLEALRTQVGHVWNAHYRDDYATTSLLANSLWLDDTMGTYDQDTVTTLAQQYYASVFRHDLGTDASNDVLSTWLDQNTGGLLSEQTQNTSLDGNTAFALLSAVNYRVQWFDKFQERDSTYGVFHGTEDLLPATYLNQHILRGILEVGSNYYATALDLEDGGKMWLILPHHGVTPQTLLDDGSFLDTVLSGNPEKSDLLINISLPKFDICASQDLKESMRALGITSVFDSFAADFSPLIPQTNAAGTTRLDKIDHAVRVAIDEDGISAAACSMMNFPTGIVLPEEEFDFVLDRPFLFVITSQDDLPLFAGIVEDPTLPTR